MNTAADPNSFLQCPQQIRTMLCANHCAMPKAWYARTAPHAAHSWCTAYIKVPVTKPAAPALATAAVLGAGTALVAALEQHRDAQKRSNNMCKPCGRLPNACDCIKPDAPLAVVQQQCTERIAVRALDHADIPRELQYGATRSATVLACACTTRCFE
jgi:hypothetical protein